MSQFQRSPLRALHLQVDELILETEFYGTSPVFHDLAVPISDLP